MGIFINLKKYFGNLSSTAVRRLIAAAVILCASVVTSLPQLSEDLRQSRIQKLDNDLLKSSAPGEQGMDAAMLDKAADFFGQYSARSLNVVRHNRIVLEKYFSEDRDTASNAFSVTKSFVSALTGIAVGQYHMFSAIGYGGQYIKQSKLRRVLYGTS